MAKIKSPEPVITWMCRECEGHPTFSHADFLKHAGQVHHISKKNEGDRMLSLHIDRRESYTSVYAWMINGLRFEQTVTCEREPDDMMRYV